MERLHERDTSAGEPASAGGGGSPGKRALTDRLPILRKAASGPPAPLTAPPRDRGDLDDPFGLHLPGAAAGVVQRKETSLVDAGTRVDDAPMDAGGEEDAGTEEDGEDAGDGVYEGVTRKVKHKDTALVSDPNDAANTHVATLDKKELVNPTDLGVGRDFNQGHEGSGKAWWKVAVVGGAHTGQEGWLQVKSLGATVKIRKRGHRDYKGKVGDGKVDVRTGGKATLRDGRKLDNTFSLTYKGDDAADARWLQFVWREIIGVDEHDASTPATGSITTTGGTYDLTDNGTFTAPGTPAKNNYNTDSAHGSDPFYEASFVADRTADATTMIDMPGAMTGRVKERFNAGAKKVVSRAHFNTFLIKGRAVTFKTAIDIAWKFGKPEDADAPPKGAHTVSGSGPANALPATIAERLHDQFPGAADIQ